MTPDDKPRTLLGDLLPPDPLAGMDLAELLAMVRARDDLNRLGFDNVETAGGLLALIDGGREK